MNYVLGILFDTRRTFHKLDNEFTNKLNFTTTIIFLLVGIGTGIKSLLEGWSFSFQPGLFWLVLYLFGTAVVSVLFWRGIISSILFIIGKGLKGQAEFIDVVVVVAYSLIPTFIEVPIAIYKVIVPREEFTSLHYGVLNSLHIVGFVLYLKIMIQGLKAFNSYGILRAIINVSPLILFPMVIYLTLYLLLSI